MSYVLIDRPDYPPGTEFQIAGLGVFKNGEEREITDEEEHAFRTRQGRFVDLEGGRNLFVLGPSLEEVIGNMNHVKMTIHVEAAETAKTTEGAPEPAAETVKSKESKATTKASKSEGDKEVTD